MTPEEIAHYQSIEEGLNESRARVDSLFKPAHEGRQDPRLPIYMKTLDAFGEAAKTIPPSYWVWKATAKLNGKAKA